MDRPIRLVGRGANEDAHADMSVRARRGRIPSDPAGRSETISTDSIPVSEGMTRISETLTSAHSSMDDADASESHAEPYGLTAGHVP